LCRKRTQAPGVLAYEDGEVVGWAAVSPRKELHEFSTSDRSPGRDDGDVWVIWCFRVRAGHGKKGVTRALLDGAVDYAKSKGAKVIDGFPVDNQGDTIDRTLAYPGMRTIFDDAGFTPLGEVRGNHAGHKRIAMRRTFD